MISSRNLLAVIAIACFAVATAIYAFIIFVGGSLSREVTLSAGVFVSGISWLCLLLFLRHRDNATLVLLDCRVVFQSFLLCYALFPSAILLLRAEIFTPVSWYGIPESAILLGVVKMYVFVTSLSLGLIFLTQGRVARSTEQPDSNSVEVHASWILAILILVYFISLAFLSALSSPVENYYENYTRYDHLSGVFATAVLVAKRLYWGVMPFIFVLAAFIFRTRPFVYVLLVVVFCGVDLYISYGARINTLLVAIQSTVAFSLFSQRVPRLRSVFALGIFGVALMSIIEVARLQTSSLTGVNLESPLFLLPGEFLALYFPAVHIDVVFSERSLDGLIMVSNDLLRVVPFGGSFGETLMTWYWQNFAPNSLVAPYTMGLFADAAAAGDWIIPFQVVGCIAGLALTIRLVSRRSLVSRAIGVYFTSATVLVLKYGVFAYVDLFVKNLLPVIAIVGAARALSGGMTYRVRVL
jgi:hypothetical protein